MTYIYIHDIFFNIFILFQSKVPINNMTLGLIGNLQPQPQPAACNYGNLKGVDANGQRRFLCSLDLRNVKGSCHKKVEDHIT